MTSKAALKRFRGAEAGGRSASYQETMWPARGIHAFSRSGHWTTTHTQTHVQYHCTICDKAITTFERTVHALGRAARGKAAVRAHVHAKHPEANAP